MKKHKLDSAEKHVDDLLLRPNVTQMRKERKEKLQPKPRKSKSVLEEDLVKHYETVMKDVDTLIAKLDPTTS